LTVTESGLEISSAQDPITLTASFGVAGFPEQGETVENLLEAADQALFKAKKAGRNQVCLAS